MPILYKGSVPQYFLWFSGVLMTKNFSGNTLQLLLNLFGIDDTKSISFFSGSYASLPDWLIYAAIHILLLLIITGLFERGEKAGVTLSFVCNGAAVRFMEPSKLYSLLDNALENAIEAVTALPKDERLISISISDENGGAREKGAQS